ncbi:MAG: pyridoxal-phosphate dependent enzyme, partial [Bosea sp.]|nr:pyridoxal-phosphate dependent enzyme [Bosea sp. (in: a-proteobacteria)]
MPSASIDEVWIACTWVTFKPMAFCEPPIFMPEQFSNPANPGVHARTTAPELLHAFEGQVIDALVAAVGTGGTVSGVGEVLKARNPSARVIAVEPAASTAPATVGNDEKNMAMLAHLLTIFTTFVGPLIIWLVKKDLAEPAIYAGVLALLLSERAARRFLRKRREYAT